MTGPRCCFESTVLAELDQQPAASMSDLIVRRCGFAWRYGHDRLVRMERAGLVRIQRGRRGQAASITSNTRRINE